jgi:hypothetical protein
MAEGLITSAQNANAIATIVAKRALARLKAATIAYSISDPSYGAEVATHGNTVNVPIPAEYTTNLLADGGTVTRQQTSLGNAQIVLNKHRELTFAITDRNASITRPDLKSTNLGQAIANFAEAVDEDLLGIYASLTGTAVGAFNTPLTEAELDLGETRLFDTRVPDALRKSVVLTGNGYSVVRQIARFTEVDKIGRGERPIADGFVGRLKNMDFYRDQKTVVTSSTQRHGVLLTPPALLTAVRPLPPIANATGSAIQVVVSEDNLSIRMTMSYNTETLADQTTLDLLYGFATGRANFGLEVKH